MKRIFCSILSVCLLTTANALATATKEEIENSQFTVDTTPQAGRSGVRLIFKKNNREAEMAYSLSRELHFPIEMKMSETLCADAPPVTTCQLLIPYRSVSAKMIWSKHPNASLIGQEVMKRKDGSPNLESLSDSGTSGGLSLDALEKYGLNKVSKKAILICNDYQWLTGQTGPTTPRWASITSWAAEVTLTNPETGLNENLTLNQSQNLSLSSRFGSYYELDSANFFSNFIGLPLVSGGPITVTTKGPDGELCQTTFSSDLTKAVRLVRAVDEEAKKAVHQSEQMPLAIIRNILSDLMILRSSLDQGQSYNGVIP